MAEFEELRLTVNLVDNASVGLTKIRGEIGLLTGSAVQLTTAVNAAAAGMTNLAQATQRTAPGVRTLNQYLREVERSARDFTTSFRSLGAATQGLSSLPQIAGGVREMAVSLHGLSGSLREVSTTASVAAVGIGSVALGIAALGASVVAYGVSVFRFAREMEALGKTAKQMGLSFAELKYAQDQAKLFGQSAESIVRSFQGVQDAQFDLWKNNSQLRQKLVGMGVDANWVNQLAAMDPNKARNAITGYGRALERQLIDAGVAKGVARALRNQFGSEFGFSAEDMDMPELPDPDPKTKEELERIRVLSEQIGKVWNEITAIWDDFSTEVLAMGLPILRDAMAQLQTQLPPMLDMLKTELKGVIDALPGFIESIPQTLTDIRTTLGDVAEIFKDVANIYNAITGQTAELKKDSGLDQAAKDKQALTDEPASPAATTSSSPAAPASAAPVGRATPAPAPVDIGNLPGFPRAGATPAPAPAPSPLTLPGFPSAQPMNYQGANDNNNPLLMQTAFTTDSLVDETDRNATEVAKLTDQLEKLNLFFERMEEGAGGGGKGGVQNAAYHPESDNTAAGADNTPIGRAVAAAKAASGGSSPDSSPSSSPGSSPGSSPTQAQPANSFQERWEGDSKVALPPTSGGTGPTPAQSVADRFPTDAEALKATPNQAVSSRFPTPAEALKPTPSQSVSDRFPTSAEAFKPLPPSPLLSGSGFNTDQVGGKNSLRDLYNSGSLSAAAPPPPIPSPTPTPAQSVSDRFPTEAEALKPTPDSFNDRFGPSGGTSDATEFSGRGRTKSFGQNVSDALIRRAIPGSKILSIIKADSKEGPDQHALRDLLREKLGISSKSDREQVAGGGGSPFDDRFAALGGGGGGSSFDSRFAALDDRSVLTAEQDSAQTVRADGKVTVKVGNANAGQSNVANDTLFASTPMMGQSAGQLTRHGPNVADTIEDYSKFKVASR